jgi:Cys-tRNA(Pro) deacylase
MVIKERAGVVYEFSELKIDPLPEDIRDYRVQIEKLVDWVHEYLCKPHPELGRGGPVCPFVPTALEKKLFFVAVYDHVDLQTDAEEIRQIILNERDRFLEQEPRSGNNAQFKTILILFPNLPEPQAHHVVDNLQSTLQEDFVDLGLMVGEFHPGPPNKGGLWNEEFRPLDCPIPLLAIRHMVPTDVLFLKDKDTLVAKYLQIFGDSVPARFQHLIEDKAAEFGFDLPDRKAKKSKSSAPTVIYLLQKNKIAYEVHRHSVYGLPIKRPHDFAQALGYDVSRISKTLLVRDPQRTAYALVVCGAAQKVNLKAVAAELGVTRLEMAGEDELREKVGHPPMAVTPIGIEGIPVFIDEGLTAHATILTGAGVPKMEIEIAPRDLIHLSGATVHSIVE